MSNALAEGFVLTGRLEPARDELDHTFRTASYRNEIELNKDTVRITSGKYIAEQAQEIVRYATLNVTATLDGLLLVSGQVIQATLEHPALRRGEGEAIWTSRVPMSRNITPEQVWKSIRIGQMGELVPPLAHALRDFRLATILPREDAAPFLWRCLESVLWFLADDAVENAATKENIQNVAAKIGVDPSLFTTVKVRVNHQQSFARHASKRYHDRLGWLKKWQKRETPAFFADTRMTGDENPVDIFPVSFTDDEWSEMYNAAWKILVRFVPYLAPFVLGSLVFPPWR